MKNHTIRMTDEEWEKCQLMGGSAWIREKINEEPLDLWINEKQDILMIIKDYYSGEKVIRIMPPVIASEFPVLAFYIRDAL